MIKGAKRKGGYILWRIYVFILMALSDRSTSGVAFNLAGFSREDFIDSDI